MKQNYFSLLLFTITMMVGGGLFAQTPCDPDGDGNPTHGPNTGEGEGTDSAAGDLAWELLLGRRCNDDDTGLRRKDYDPSDQCNNSSNLIPETGFNSVKIAIIDSGVRPTAPGKFNGHSLFSYTVKASGVVDEGVAFPHPHGTYSAGVISGMLTRNSTLAFWQDNPAHEFYDYQVLNGDLRTSLAAVIAAIDHAVSNGVELISLSIGFVPHECDGIDWENQESPLYLAIERARNNNVIVITSAGNDNKDLAVNPQYPAAYADLENLISVGALSCEGETRAAFSNYGENIVDLFTTGAFVSVYYNGCFHSINGTSFSTSIVAGKAALHLTNEKSMNRALCLLRSQTKPFWGDQQAIYGIVDVPTDVPEGDVCINEETYDPNGSSEADEPTSGGGGKETGGLSDPTWWKPSAGNNNSTTDQELTVLTSPNPFSDQLRVDIESLNGKATISLLDGHGRRMLSREVTQPSVQLDLSQLPAGVYWLNVRNAESNQTRAVVKQ